jgi:hypothetical protein
MKPEINEIPEFYRSYVNETSDADLIEQLLETRDDLIVLMKDMSTEKSTFRYAAGKWTPKEMILHIMDAERVFSYRALRFSRGDQTDLPGFKQDDYVATCEADNRSMSSLITEYTGLRNSTIEMFKNFSKTQLNAIGSAGGNQFSAISIGYILAGHQIHHIKILRERYLS